MKNEAFFSPLSFAQERLWFLDMLEPERATHNVKQAFRISGPLNVENLRRAFNAIVTRHESLRTTIFTVDGVPMQRIVETGLIDMPVIDVRGHTEDDREVEAKRLAAEEFRRPFDLAQGPLLRVHLLRLGDNEHILLLNMSHIVSDDWSMTIVVQEMVTLYEAFLAGNSSPLPELSLQYSGFARWQRERLKGDFLEAQTSYWKKQLGGNPPMLELPMDRPRPALQTYRGKRKSLVLGKNLSGKLNAISHQEGASLFMTLLAAFKTLLHRYTGQDDIIVGSPITNRNRPEIEGMIGLFANTLVLRGNLSEDPTFQELLYRMREVVTGAYAHQEVPFEKLLEELHVPRSLSYDPLFQVMFVLQNTPLQPLQFCGLILTPLEVATDTAKFDLLLELSEGSSGLTGAIEYNTDLFDDSSIERMAGHFQTLLQGIADNPQEHISQLPLLTEPERHQILFEWNDTRVEYPRDLCVHQLFEAQVERMPDAVGVVFEDQQLTYRQLNSRANQLARYLRKLSVGPETCVGIYTERSLDMVVGILAILKAGGAYLPLDQTYPAERIALMIKDAQVPLLLTQERLDKDLPAHKARVVHMDADWPTISTESEENVHSGVTPDNPSYVIYTSGSTGNPKGVMVCHRSIVNFFTGMDEHIPHDPPGVWLAVTGLSFDISALELLWTLARGFKVILYTDRPWYHALVEPSSRIADKDAEHSLFNSTSEHGGNVAQDYSIPAQIKRHKVTHFQCTPSMASMLLLDDETCTALKSLQIFLVGGEALPVALAAQLTHIVSGNIINMYGPTETTIWSSTYPVNAEQGTIPIGRPIANTEIYILDNNMQPVPVGITGELFIGGDGVARGYLNRPDLTAERFIKDPFSDKPGARLYRTGDLARYRADGNIEFLGRIDHQVKIRGYRIELGEIETLLEKHPAIHEAVVLAREDTSGDKRLVAYIIPNQNQKISRSELRDYVKQKLPEFMVPSHFVTLETFPLTPNKKIDRKALPAPVQVQIESETAYVPPKNELQRAIIDIWQALLNIPKVGIDDNFFELGGHSLLVVKAYFRLREVTNGKLTITDMFRFPTIRTLTEYLSQDSGSVGQNTARKSTDRAKTRRAAIIRRQQMRRRAN